MRAGDFNQERSKRRDIKVIYEDIFKMYTNLNITEKENENTNHFLNTSHALKYASIN